MSEFFQLVPDVIFMEKNWLSLKISLLFFFEGDKTGSKGVKTEKQDSKESKLGVEQEEKPPAIPSAYDEDLMLRAAMYGVLFQAYADKVKGDYTLLLFLSYFFVDNILFTHSNGMRQMKEWLYNLGLTLRSDFHVTSSHGIQPLFSKRIMSIFKLIK